MHNIKELFKLSVIFIAGGFVWGQGDEALASFQQHSQTQQEREPLPQTVLFKPQPQSLRRFIQPDSSPISQPQQPSIILLFASAPIAPAMPQPSPITATTTSAQQQPQATSSAVLLPTALFIIRAQSPQRQSQTAQLAITAQQLLIELKTSFRPIIKDDQRVMDSLTLPQVIIAINKLISLGFSLHNIRAKQVLLALKLKALECDDFHTNHLNALNKLFDGYHSVRRSLLSHQITSSVVRAMMLLNDNRNGRFDGLRDPKNFGPRRGSTTEPSMACVTAVVACLYGVNNTIVPDCFGTDDVMAAYYLRVLDPDDLNGAPRITNPTAEQFQAMASVNRHINQIIDNLDEALDMKEEVAWRIRAHNEIPDVLPIIRYDYHHAFPAHTASDAGLELL
jgi:hypothetical protein